MKYELDHENRITTDVLIDAIATQTSFEAITDNSDHLKGYVHYIINNPENLNQENFHEISSENIFMKSH